MSNYNANKYNNNVNVAACKELGVGLRLRLMSVINVTKWLQKHGLQLKKEFFENDLVENKIF